MSKKTISFFLSAKSINQAIKELQNYQRELPRKVDYLMERLAVIGGHEASVRFTQAIYDGLNDSSVSVERIENGWAIVAKGDAVCFIEFGSGVYHNPSEPYPNPRPEGVVGIGEYGQKKGQRQTWGYYGEPGTNGNVVTTNSGKEVVLTHGNPAAMPMWYASEEIRREVEAVAQEVFGV